MSRKFVEKSKIGNFVTTDKIQKQCVRKELENNDNSETVMTMTQGVTIAAVTNIFIYYKNRFEICIFSTIDLKFIEIFENKCETSNFCQWQMKSP